MAKAQNIKGTGEEKVKEKTLTVAFLAIALGFFSFFSFFLMVYELTC